MSVEYTLAIGVDRYPHFPDDKQLRFARRDAEQFAAWAEAHGAQATRLLSAPDGPPTPVRDEVDTALFELLQRFDRELADTLPPLVAQVEEQARLHLFFSGHGVGPSGNEIALLMADARPGMLRNMGARAYLSFLRTLGRWRQVWLFADCCRERRRGIVPGVPSLDLDPPVGSQVFAAEFYAVPHGDLAFEPDDPGTSAVERHGLFSRCLLEGLWGAAAHPVSGAITADSLRVWLKRRLHHVSEGRQRLHAPSDDPDLVLGTVDLRLPGGDPDSRDRMRAFVDAMLERLGSPRPDDDPSTLRGVVEQARAACLDAFDSERDGNPFLPDDDSVAPQVAVELQFPDGFTGDATLLRGDLTAVATHAVASDADRAWRVSLPEGLYLIEPFLPFQIRPGTEHVSLQAS